MEHGIAAWSSPEWPLVAQAWVDEVVDGRTGPVVVSRVRSWSAVATVEVRGERLWLKAMGPANAFEAGLYEVLARHAPEHALAPVAADPARGLLLLPHAEPLADFEMAAVLPDYARMQRALMPHVDELLAAGVPDMRAAVMPDRYAEALRDIETSPELERFAPTFERWCAELAESPVPDSLDHNDLHPNNVVTGPRFYDWGDSAVAHPFASLLVPYKQTDDKAALRRAYLAGFADLAPVAELERQADLAVRVGVVARALCWQRALSSGGAPPEFADAAVLTLRSVLQAAG
ncbi:phosphotransferase family protein [Actinokineospora pegani]|uniref:phosphotransferase n=1 Tax=Actinokineospora pegani TaxID=2654637 RepID=UPI0012E9A077|nr:phosphotransferase [Actinokineospora pegani]